MDITSRIKIRLRQRKETRAPQVQVREKALYSCSGCRNQYYDYHLFCPQCLGEVAPVHPRMSLLRIVAIPQGKALELGQLLATLTGKKEFAFQKALESLPWIMIQQTDEGILRHWKEVLEAEQSEAEIVHWQPSPKRSWRGKAPAFVSDAPPPLFFQGATAESVRHVAKSLRDPQVRLSWVETVLAGLRMIEDFYKRHPTHRLLFSDFLFHIEHDLRDAAKDYDALFKANEREMTRRIAEIKSRFDDMAREILEVRQQVEDQL